jgi:hypothetical protein
MKEFLGRVRAVCLIALVIGITAILMPALMYKASAESAEELIIFLSDENITIVNRTAETITAMLGLPLDSSVVKENIQIMLNTKYEKDVDSKIRQMVRNYRLPITLQDQERFSEYIKQKRIYFLQNSDKITRYVDEYKAYLDEPLAGFYLRITGFPKRISITQEL